MKKNYQKPSIEVIKFKMKSHLLTGSEVVYGKSTSKCVNFGGDANDEEGE